VLGPCDIVVRADRFLIMLKNMGVIGSRGGRGSTTQKVKRFDLLNDSDGMGGETDTREGLKFTTGPVLKENSEGAA